MLAEFTQWLLQLVSQFFAALWQFVVDSFINLVDLLMAALAGLFSLIPVPGWLSGGLGQIYNQLDPAIVYLLNASGVPAGLAIIGLAYVFRLGRKIFTLFQW